MPSRRIPNALLGILAFSALLLALTVIPAVKTDPFPAATPERAIRALWIIVGCNLMLALFVFTLARATTAFATLAWRLAACFVALPALLMAVALTDGGVAYWSHGRAMHAAAVTMLVCAAGNALAGALTVVMGLSRAKDAAT